MVCDYTLMIGCTCLLWRPVHGVLFGVRWHPDIWWCMRALSACVECGVWCSMTPRCLVVHAWCVGLCGCGAGCAITPSYLLVWVWCFVYDNTGIFGCACVLCLLWWPVQMCCLVFDYTEIFGCACVLWRPVQGVVFGVRWHPNIWLGIRAVVICAGCGVWCTITP